LTVGELIELLQQFDADMPVVVSAQSGDHWRRIIASDINDNMVDGGYIVWSDYHDTWKVVEDPDNDDEATEAVIIGPASW
jgi:hypothetical protein